MPFEVFNKCATLKFKLSWNKGENQAGSSQDEYLQNNQIAKEIQDNDISKSHIYYILCFSGVNRGNNQPSI